MDVSKMNRRDFQRLTAAAFGGVVSGVVSGSLMIGPAIAADDEAKSLLDEPHVCRGLNACKGKGGCGATKAKNACAGQGACATVAKHSCKGENACKGARRVRSQPRRECLQNQGGMRGADGR